MQLCGLPMKKVTRIHEYLHQLDELFDHIAKIYEEVSEFHIIL